jgi:hypothetical protein
MILKVAEESERSYQIVVTGAQRRDLVEPIMIMCDVRVYPRNDCETAALQRARGSCTSFQLRLVS